MKRFKWVVILLVLILMVAAALSIIPNRSYSVGVKEGFRYGPPDNQITINRSGTYVRAWRGFPATIKEIETVRYGGEGYYESTMHNIQPFNVGYLIANIMFWTAFFIAILAPIPIFYRPKAKAHDDVADADDIATSPSMVTEEGQPVKHKDAHENHRD